jgi:DNA-binding transcriptional regulator GbsR (MarR family)
MKLSKEEQRFVIHWGEMGTRWGINRVVAQIYALLFISPNPLNAEEISDALSLARSTVSTGLRELQSWKIILVQQKLGDRRDYFKAIEDVWDTFRVVIDERKRREMDPTINVLEDIVANIRKESPGYNYAYSKLQELLDFFETMQSLYLQGQAIPMITVKKLAKSRNVVTRIFGFLSR